MLSKYSVYKVILFIIVLIAILSLILKDKELDDILPFLDKGVGHWEKTGKLIYPRDSFLSLTKMRNGNVLVVSGNGYRSESETEIYYPKENVFRKAGKIGHMLSHEAYLLEDGRVFIVATCSRNDGMHDTWMYYPDKDVFEEAKPIKDIYGQGIYLKNGYIMYRNSKLYNPVKEIYKELPRMQYGRKYAGMNELDDGNVIITGGTVHPNHPKTTGNGYLDSKCKLQKGLGYYLPRNVEMYDSKKNKFVLQGKLVYPRTDHWSVKLPDGNILIGGGNTYGKLKMLDPKVFYKNLDPIRKNALRYTYVDESLQEVELYNVKTQTSKVIGKLNYAVGPWKIEENIVKKAPILLKGRYVFIAFGPGRRDEIIDTKTFKIYPVKKMPKRMFPEAAVKLDEETILFVGHRNRYKFPYGYIFKLGEIKE